MKRFMRGVLVILGAGLASSTQGGIITSGSFHVGSSGFESATVSGENFTATVISTDGGPWYLGGLPPFQAPPIIPLTWPGEPPSGVLYNGSFYSAPGLDLPPSGPWAALSFTENLISPKPIVTGPGTYSLDLFSVTLDFTLRDPSGTILHSETDTGFATGSITYTGNATTTFVNSLGFDATIIPEPIPEPSTWSLIALAACFRGAFAAIRLRERHIMSPRADPRISCQVSSSGKPMRIRP
jgi:hypothetical protein